MADVIEAIRNNFINNYCGGDESKMEDTAVSYGYDSLDVLEKEWSDGATSSIKLELVVKAIAAAEKIEIDEDDSQVMWIQSSATTVTDQRMPCTATMVMGTPYMGKIRSG